MVEKNKSEVNLGAKLKQLRESKGFTMEQLAFEINQTDEKLNANKSMISKWENNKISPKNIYLSAYVKIFNISLNELLGLEPEENRNIITYRIDTKGLKKEQVNELKKDLETFTTFLLEKLRNNNK